MTTWPLTWFGLGVCVGIWMLALVIVVGNAVTP
jgi:hypothetical protein